MGNILSWPSLYTNSINKLLFYVKWARRQGKLVGGRGGIVEASGVVYARRNSNGQLGTLEIRKWN